MGKLQHVTTRYCIRKLIYFREGEVEEVREKGGVIASFTDLKQARQFHEDLEINAFRSVHLGKLDELSREESGYFRIRFQLRDYCRDELGVDIMEHQHLPAPYDNDRLYVKPGHTLPGHITNEQVWKIRNLTGIRFYELFEFRGDADEWEDFVDFLQNDLPEFENV